MLWQIKRTIAKPATIGKGAWIGGSVVICPVVTIIVTVIGAGSVVTKNIPSDVFAAGISMENNKKFGLELFNLYEVFPVKMGKAAFY